MKRLLLGATLVVALFTSIPLHHASASLGACKTDPIFNWTVGSASVVVTETVSIADDAANVTHAYFVSNTPSGSQLVQTEDSGDLLAVSVLYPVSNLAAGYYGEAVYIQDANTASVVLTGTVSINGVLQGGTATGTTNEWIEVLGH